MNLDSFLRDAEEIDVIVTDQTFIAVAVIGGGVLVVVLGVALAVWMNKFNRELKRVNRRIRQSESERERQHYLRRRRGLYLSIIPFVKYDKYK